MGDDGSPGSICILVPEPLFYRIVDVQKPLFDHVVLVREPLLIRVAFIAEKRGISLICVPKNSTSSAERAIDRSMHRLRRGFAIHYCYVRTNTRENQEMGKHFTDVELASTSY